MKAMSNIMLIPISYAAYHFRSACAIDIIIILHAVFTVFVDFKNWLRDGIETTLKGRALSDSQVMFYMCVLRFSRTSCGFYIN